MIAIKLG